MLPNRDPIVMFVSYVAIFSQFLSDNFGFCKFV